EVVLTMPPRGSLKEAKEFAQKHGGWIAARLKRLPEAAPFAHGVEIPLRGEAHRIVNRRGARGTVWTETNEGGKRVLCVAGEPPPPRLSQARGAARPRGREPALRGQARRCHQAHLRARPVEPLGLVLEYRRVVVFLAAHSRAHVRARLPCRARGVSSRGA